MYFVCFLAALLTSDPTPAQTTVSEGRWHWTVETSRGRGKFEITEIGHLSQADDRVVVLIRTPTGVRLIATNEANYETQTFDYEIRDAQSNEFLRLRVKFASKARTRKESTEELRQSRKVLESPVPFEITGPNHQLAGVESHWRDAESAKKLRPTVRQMISPEFLQKLEPLHSGLLGASFLGVAAERLMEYLFEPADKPAEVFLTRAIPNCDFDKSFGYPCSAEQKQAAAAAAAGKTPRFENMY